MKLCVKRYSELTRDELYALVKLRIAVFIVEQNCPYMELDDWDQAAVHVWLEDDEGIEAYLRVMDRGVESEHVSIGRVIAVKRRSGIGTQVLSEGIRVANTKLNLKLYHLWVSFTPWRCFIPVNVALLRLPPFSLATA